MGTFCEEQSQKFNLEVTIIVKIYVSCSFIYIIYRVYKKNEFFLGKEDWQAKEGNES